MEKGRDAAILTDDYVHENPWQAIGIGAAIGFLSAWSSRVAESAIPERPALTAPASGHVDVTIRDSCGSRIAGKSFAPDGFHS